MTGSDDGGFQPHPGDPWHPGWTDDAGLDADEEARSAVADEEDAPPASKKPKAKRSRRGRRRRSAAGDDPDPAFDPTSTAFDDADEVVEAEDDSDGEDPFGAVLEREGRRRSAGGDEDVPPPAWTIDEEPGDDPLLPIEQPSWVGQTTVADSGVEAVGFEPIEPAESLEPSEQLEPSESAGVVEAPEPVEPPEVSEAAEPAELLETSESAESPEMSEPSAALEPPESPEPAAVGDSGPAEVIGTYGVAGPEAFDALATDDTGELDDWEAYMAEPAVDAVTAPPEAVEADVEPAPDVIDEGEAAEPKRRRGLFGRRRDRKGEVPAAAEPFEEVAADVVEAGAAAAETIPPLPPFSPPTEPLAGDDEIGEWIESEERPRRGLFRRKRRDPEPIDEEVAFEAESVDVDEWFAVEAQAIDAASRVPSDVAEHEIAQPITEDLASDGAIGDADAPDSPPSAVIQQPVAEDRSAPVAVPSEAAGGVEDAEVEDGEWLGDASGIPDEWFAEVDEDVVVPPPVADTPETVWVDEEEDAGVEPGVTGSLFDIEAARGPQAPQPAAPVEQVPEMPEVPQGYEPWGAAVEEAVASSAGAEPVDDGTYEYEQPLLSAPSESPDDLPAGFEPFPTEMEQFELSEETLRSEMTPSVFEEGWVTSDVDPGADLPVGTSEEVVIDAGIYAGGSTIEHRDLAAAIAEAGAENTQWQAISAAMPGLETGVVGFADVADLESGGEYMAPTRSNLGVRVATGLVLVGLLFGSLLLADAAFAIFVGLMVVLGLGEFYAALRRAGYLALSLFGLIGGAATLAAVWFHGPLAIPAGILLTSTSTFFFYAFSPTRRDALANGGLTVLGVGWIIGGVAFAIPIARAPDRVVLVFAIVAVTAAADIGAFSFGRAWGKTPLSPVLSPNKTVEGLVGGIVLGLAAAGAIGFFELGPFDLRSALALGVIVSALAPLGDLSESLVKRSLGIKDMGGTLPGHGGILDRIDAFLFVIPAAWVLFQTIGYLG